MSPDTGDSYAMLAETCVNIIQLKNVSEQKQILLLLLGLEVFLTD